MPSCHYDFTHFRGRWSKERDKKTNEVMDGYQAVSSNYGRSSHEENPFVYLENKDIREVISELKKVNNFAQTNLEVGDIIKIPMYK